MVNDPKTMFHRYENDPVFHTLVSVIENAILQGTYTPSEVREATYLAQYRVQLRHPVATTVFPNTFNNPKRRCVRQKDETGKIFECVGIQTLTPMCDRVGMPAGNYWRCNSCTYEAKE